MKKISHLILCSLFFYACTGSASSIQVRFNDVTYAFPEQSRLSTLVNAFGQNQSEIDWPSAVLYQVDTKFDKQLLKQQQQVLADLKQLIIFWHEDKVLSAELSALYREIHSWQFGIIVDNQLDIDAFRLKQETNPVLTNGSYVLWAKKRPNYVTLIGLGGRADVMHEHNKATYQYLFSANFSDEMKNIDEVYHIEGKSIDSARAYRTIPVAFWNKTPEPVANAAVLYVPISAKILTEKYQTLNSQILDLLQYRIAQ